MRTRLPLLLALCAGLAHLALREDGPVLPDPPPARAAAAAAFNLAPPPGPPSGPWHEQVARPLFVSTRRPPEPPRPPEDPPPPPRPAPLGASGIVLRGEAGTALLRLADGTSARVTRGGEVDGWLVERITRDGVELRNGDQSVTVNARISGGDGAVRTR